MDKFELKTVAGPHHRYYTPVECALQASQIKAYESVALKESKTGRVIPAQLIPTSDPELVKLVWLVDELRAGATRSYTLVNDSDERIDEGVELDENPTESVLDVKIDHQFFARYHFSHEYSKPFLYPVIGPFGSSVTRHFPMQQNVPGETTDHIHHRSIYTSHGDMNGSDNWSEEPGHGFIVHKGFGHCVSGSALGEFVAENEWQDARHQSIVREQRRIRIYRQPADRRIIDYEVTFSADWGNVRFGDTKEGGILSVRVASSMDGVRDGLITNGHGAITEAETWGKHAAWCDYSGPVDDRWQGITLFDHPESFRYPTTWHVRDYGLMTANPFGLSHFKNDKNWDGSHVLKQGQQMRFFYRIFIHSGDVTDGGVKERYFDFIFPPKAVIFQP
ncbi:PmoA family protein [candidate division KSB1 bacterium]|nr:PmoA family protein [candidate division KSB1 bacterium]